MSQRGSPGSVLSGILRRAPTGLATSWRGAREGRSQAAAEHAASSAATGTAEGTAAAAAAVRRKVLLLLAG